MKFSPLASPEIVEMKCHSDEICVILAAAQEVIEMVISSAVDDISSGILIRMGNIISSISRSVKHGCIIPLIWFIVPLNCINYILTLTYVHELYFINNDEKHRHQYWIKKKIETPVLIFLVKTYNNFCVTRAVIPKGPIFSKSVLVQVMDWRLPGDKPLPEPIQTKCLTPYGFTRPQWVK